MRRTGERQYQKRSSSADKRIKRAFLTPFFCCFINAFCIKLAKKLVKLDKTLYKSYKLCYNKYEIYEYITIMVNSNRINIRNMIWIYIYIMGMRDKGVSSVLHIDRYF